MFAACCQCSVLFFYRIYIRRKVLIRETHNSLGAMCLPDREEEIREDFLKERVCKHSGVGEAVLVRIAADDVVENADAQNCSGFDKSDGAVAIFAAWSGIAGRVRMGANDRRTIGDYSSLENTIGRHYGRAETTLGYEVDPNQPVLVIQ